MIRVFTYGTLRVGQPNYGWALHGKYVSVTPATLAGARMWDYGAYPFVTLDGDPNDTVTGDLFTIKDAYAERVMRDLDHLEGYRPGDPGSLYNRLTVPVTTPTETVDAWTYVAGPSYAPRLATTLPRVHNGDWLSPLMAH